LEHLAAAEGDNVALILSDIGMEGISGLELLAKVRSFAPYLPVVLLSGSCDQPLAVDAYRTGASDYLLKPVSEKDLIDMVRKHHGGCEPWSEELIRRQVCNFLLPAIDSDADRSARLQHLFESLGRRRFETMQHSQRVAAFCRLIGLNYGIQDQALAKLEIGALLHDIGKVAVPQNVIEKPGRLSEEEWRVMKLHPAIGASLLSEIPDCHAESDIVLCHHERFDGDGYPNRLRGAQIPIGARIFAVADTLDAICSMRPYRAASPLALARKEIDAMSGSQFDPAIVRSFQSVNDSSIAAIQNIYAESEAENALFSLASASLIQDRPPGFVTFRPYERAHNRGTVGPVW